MSRWFRFYDDVINDPKVLKLPDATRWQWVAILCVASKHSGRLPALEELAFYLRTTPAKATVLLAALVKAGLLDKTDDGFAPHNWSGRQYQSDYSADRVKKYRQRRAEAGLVQQWQAPKKLRDAVYDRDGGRCVYCGSTENLTLDHRTPVQRGGTDDQDNLQTACRACNASKRDMTHDEFLLRNASVTLLKRPQKAEEQNTEQKDDGIGSAGASAFTKGSRVLATSFLNALGFDTPLKVPPEFAGVDWRAVEWERAGWTADLIDAETRKNAGKPLSYHEKCFATAFARRQAPLPVAVIKKQETVHVAKSARGGISSALDRLIEQAEGNSIGGLEGGQAAPRLLSNR